MIVKRKLFAVILFFTVTAAAMAFFSGCGLFAASTAEVIDSADDVKGKNDALYLDVRCKEYYSGILVGIITSDSIADDGSRMTNLPPKGAAGAERFEAANTAVVKDVLKYYGLQHDNISLFGYIYAENSEYKKGKVVLCSEYSADIVRPLSMTTALGELYGE